MTTARLPEVSTWRSVCDLRHRVHEPDARERRRDCPDVVGEPVVVIVVFVLAMLVFLWGLFAAASYLAGRDRNLSLVWWQTSVTFVVITLIAFCVPFRLRFSGSLYGIAFVMLIVEWAVFQICFPVAWLTAEHADVLRAHYASISPKNQSPSSPLSLDPAAHSAPLFVT